MVKYTKEDINIFGDEERALNAIGKKCYFGYDIDEILAKANNDSDVEVLEKCNPMVAYPFISTKGFYYRFMIVKKEEPKEYVPFDTIEEFIKASLEHNKNHVLSSTGIWFEEKTFDKNGELGDYYIYNIDSFDMINNIVFSGETSFNFSQLLKSKATFLDGTPCGKLKE